MLKKILATITNNKGQNKEEFILMMGVVVSVVVLIFSLFHKQLVGGFFTIIGYVLT